ncbi:MAG: hypothetical protein OXG37_13880 [Actinomycetia bacterium]|nr:hypothetical protein [Actinomycetes bacterium]
MVYVLAGWGVVAAGCGGNVEVWQSELRDPEALVTEWRLAALGVFRDSYNLSAVDLVGFPAVEASLDRRRALIAYGASGGHTAPLVEVTRSEGGLVEVAVTLRLPPDGAVTARYALGC